MKLGDPSPVVLFFNDGSAGLLTGVDPIERVALIKDPQGRESELPVPVDELRLSEVWTGDVLLVRKPREAAEGRDHFDIFWVLRLILREKTFLRDIGIASMVTSVLGIIPPFLVMSMIDRVITYGSMNTLTLLGLIWVTIVGYETVLEYARVDMVTLLAGRIDARLNLHVFNRMLGLKLDYFEQHPAGEIHHRINQLYLVRNFFTGRMFELVIDVFMLIVLIPILFYMSSSLAFVALATALVMALIVIAFMPAATPRHGPRSCGRRRARARTWWRTSTGSAPSSPWRSSRRARRSGISAWRTPPIGGSRAGGWVTGRGPW